MSSAGPAGSEGPPAAPSPAVRAGLARGRALFNRADFWGSHEAIEAAWHAAVPDDRPILQGLIQAGAAFHKFVVQDNPTGARRLLVRALARLDRVPDGRFGLALAPFRAQLRQWADRLGNDPSMTGPVVGLPRLEWAPSMGAEAMSVDAVRLHEVRVRDRRAMLVAVEAEGTTGWGECRMQWETHGLWSSLTDALAPALLTEPVAMPSELSVIWSGLVLNPCAEAGLEAALWDVWARRNGVSLAAALAIVARPVVLLGRVVGAELDQLRASLTARLAEGYRHLIVPARPNADRRVVPQLIADCPVPVAVELGAAYRPSDVKALQALDDIGLRWMAQPVAPWNLADAITLTRWLATPVSMGGWVAEEQAAGGLALKALDVLHVDPGVTGLAEAARIGALAAARAVPMWVAGSATTTVGAAADLALAAHPGVTLPSDIGLVEPVGDGVAIGPDGGGTARPEWGVGLGVVPSEAWLEAVTVRRAAFRA